MNLKVPFAEKDQAKALGARWDAGRKTWYVEGRADLSAFARWSQTAHAAGGGPRPSAAAAPPHPEADGRIHVGARYVERPRVCDCLPWEGCQRCRDVALP